MTGYRCIVQVGLKSHSVDQAGLELIANFLPQLLELSHLSRWVLLSLVPKLVQLFKDLWKHIARILYPLEGKNIILLGWGLDLGPHMCHKSKCILLIWHTSSPREIKHFKKSPWLPSLKSLEVWTGEISHEVWFSRIIYFNMP